jgi:hypothetical protein
MSTPNSELRDLALASGFRELKVVIPLSKIIFPYASKLIMDYLTFIERVFDALFGSYPIDNLGRFAKLAFFKSNIILVAKT